MIEEVKKKVQHSGHTMMRRFDTFGRSNPLLPMKEEEPKEDIINKIEELKEMLYKSENDPTKLLMSHLELLKLKSNAQSMRNLIVRKEKKKKLKRVVSVQPELQTPPDHTTDNEKKKALIDTLENTKLNNELVSYITSKLDEMMVEYNSGFIMALELDEKVKLKQSIEHIYSTYDIQQKNEDKVAECQNKNDLFQSNLLVDSSQQQENIYTILGKAFKRAKSSGMLLDQKKQIQNNLAEQQC